VETIPEYEWEIFFNTIDDAVGLAMLGRIGDGFRRLELGLLRAEEIAEESAWGEELRTRYRKAMDRFTQRYGARFIE
jgi:hypothetical protein